MNQVTFATAGYGRVEWVAGNEYQFIIICINRVVLAVYNLCACDRVIMNAGSGF